MPELQPSVAIIGSGPAGCYCAQFLKKLIPDAEVVIFEALPVPYGLLRYGVAADHQGTKNVSAQFERLFTRGGVRFAGNVEVGTDVSLEDLQSVFDVVVMASGLSDDRKLGIPGDNQKNVFGAGRILRALNGYPKRQGREEDELRQLGKRVIVIGNGNVAMDVIRLLAKSDEELIGSDIDDSARSALQTDKIRVIDVIGRSPIEAAKFDLAMLREVCHLKKASVSWPGSSSGSQCLAADLLLSTAANGDNEGEVTIRFHFSTTPILLSSRGSETVMTVTSAGGGEIKDLLCDSVITAVGFCHNSSTLPSQAPGVYYTGWARRGPSGTVAENRRDASEVAATIVKDLHNRPSAAAKPGFRAIKQQIMHKVVSFEQWQMLDRHEILTASQGRCRTKLTSTTLMLSLMGSLTAKAE